VVHLPGTGPVVVSYWAGNLPNITKLHFLSYHANKGSTSYVLFLDSNPKFESEIPIESVQYLKKLGIQIEKFDLEKSLIDFSIPSFGDFNNSYSSKILRLIFNRCLQLISLLSNKNQLLKKFLSTILPSFHYSDSLNFFVPSHNLKWFGLSDNLAYRSDLFRSVIISKITERSILYVDLDICFVKNLNELDWDISETGSWGDGPHANTAFFKVAKDEIKLKSTILTALQNGIPAFPWTLYTAKFCSENNLIVLPVKLVDPAWAPGSLVVGNPDMFFKKSNLSEFIVEEFFRNCIVVHWHNRWNIIPEKGSPFDLLLEKFSDN
jgi:hypothetical protein